MPAAIHSIRSRFVLALIGAGLVSSLVGGIPPWASASHPFVSTTGAQYAQCGRVFPDPHAYWPSSNPGADRSPFAKGRAVCAADDFLTYQGPTNGMVQGMTFLESLFPDFIEFYELEQDFGGGQDCAATTDPNDMCSAGLPQIGGTRRRSDLYMVRVTDERVPEKDKKFFVFPLSIHGIERAGAEAGTRMVEDLATWGYCEAVANGETVTPPPATINCAQEGAIPHPLLETQPDTSVTAGTALRQSSIYFVYANPDGWRRGDPDNVFRFYQRYNGNGVDMNRDWPTIGYTFRPYTPWSEPETRSFGQVLQGIRQKWDGGIDLHGQLIDRAFSFTLLGASERDFSKNQRILQTVKGAWEDAEKRLEWSPLIVPNDQEVTCEDTGTATVCDGMHGVQWGTVWDTIDYTVTGSLGDWIDSPLGLGADGIDNEMSLSHLSNCGTGSCYAPEAEQLHIDGNKSLVYAMVNFSLVPEDDDFVASGDVGYVFSPKRLKSGGSAASTSPFAGLDPQPDIMNVRLDPSNDFTHEFEILGPNSTPAHYNGSVIGTATPVAALGAIGGASLNTLYLERYREVEENPDPPPPEDAGCADASEEEDKNWEQVNSYFNQSSVYLQGGQAVHGNFPSPGRWRICFQGDLETQLAGSGGYVDLDITFAGEQGWTDPGQLPYSVSNMQFYEDLAGNMRPAQLTKLDADKVLSEKTKLSGFDSVVISDDAFPGYSEGVPSGAAQEPLVFNTPGAGTAPCAGGDGAPATCRRDHPFEVNADFNNQRVIGTLTGARGDWDMFIQRQSRIDPNTWFTVANGTSGSLSGESITLLNPIPGNYRLRLVNWAASPTPTDKLEITYSNEYAGPPVVKNTRSKKDVEKWGDLLRNYVKEGGNLVLTDGAILDLALMGLIPRDSIAFFNTYAGYIGFTTDYGATETYGDPLAANVNQPGAAEGDAHRHQTYEPVPIGYAIQDEAGLDFNSSPVWAVEQTAWEGAGARTVGTTSPELATLGELPLGKGQVRIIGPLVPMPTEAYDHPFGLANYAVTYTGYQLLNNALQLEGVGPGGGLSGCGRLAKLDDINKLYGTAGKDVLKGTSGADAICGGPGDDTIRGLDGNDILIGGKGNDRVVGGSGNDKLFLGAGNDRANGGKGKDRLVGFKGNDRLGGGGQRDSLNGQSGIDTCKGGAGKDKLRRCET